jgi:CIC family chloride channel protein
MFWRTINITFQVSVTGIVIGTIVSLCSIGFVFGVQNASNFRTSFGSCLFDVGGLCFSVAPLFFLFITATIIIIVKKYLNIARYHGPADVILSAHSNGTDLDVKTGFLSTFAAFVSASGGASVGQYGPLVHLGGTIGSLIKRYTQNILTRDVFIGCGVAAAISAGFNSPIGGMSFAHEAILRHFSFRAIAPIAISSVVSATIGNQFFPSGILFQNTDADIAVLPSVSISLLLGPICAIIAVAFMRGLLSLQANLNKISSSEVQRIYIAALICGLCGGMIPEILGLGGDTIEGILANSYSLAFLFIILGLKLCVTIVCLSMGFFGGVFSPALVLGASVGAILTAIAGQVGIDILGDSLILAAMAALSASVIGAPIASIVIIFELTQSYDLAFVAITCVASSCVISNVIFGHSFFDKQLLNRDFKISRGRTEILLSEITVGDLLGKNDFLKVQSNITKKDLLRVFEKSEFTEVYFVNDNGLLLGKTKVNALLQKNNTTLIEDTSPLTLNIKLDVSDAIVKVSNFVGESIPVVDNDGKLLGVLNEADLFLQYLKVQDEISHIEKD